MSARRDSEPALNAEVVIGDAFGAALSACFEGGAKHGVALQIIERDDGFIESNDMALYFATRDEWDELDRWACDDIAGRALDIGAGAGRHALYLQERGCAVTALDVSLLAVDVCSRRGVRDVFAGTVEDLVATRIERFDAFVLLGNNLGLLRDRDYAKTFLEMLAAIARPGAKIVGTCINPYKSGHADHLAYHDRNRRAGRMAGQVRIRIRHRRLATPWWDYLFMSPDELTSVVTGTSWRIVEHRQRDPLYAVRMTLRSP